MGWIGEARRKEDTREEEKEKDMSFALLFSF